MTAAEYLVDALVRRRVTDVFGIPGGVVLDFLYALDAREEIRAHLSCHEQCAAFAAAGYAQASGRLGAAYATKGPGIANMLTPIADAYSDSTPLVVVTAHSERERSEGVRFVGEQELDTERIFSSVTKRAVRIDSAEAFSEEIERACDLALSGRKGPVLVDVLAGVWRQEVRPVRTEETIARPAKSLAAEAIRERLKTTRRPVLLVGDGIHQAGAEQAVRELAERAGIPALSSRCAADIMPTSPMYFGYVGSHGMRWSNFILSKTDLIIALGNRLAFPVESESFKRIFDRAEILWVEADEREAARKLPRCACFREDMRDALAALAGMDLTYSGSGEWLKVCQELKMALEFADRNEPVRILEDVFRCATPDMTIVCDVGNNEFWASRAYLAAGISNRLLYSKSFGALGCALGKGIGAHYATKRPALCVVGDQGMQLNSQELQFIGAERLPIAILLMNNCSSGMIRSREKQRYGDHFIHTTIESGYSAPDFQMLARAYGIEHCACSPASLARLAAVDGPVLIEAQFGDEHDLEPNLPRGNPCQAMVPPLDAELFEKLDAM